MKDKPEVVYAIVSSQEEAEELIKLLPFFKVVTSVYPAHNPADETMVISLVDDQALQRVLRALKSVGGLVPNMTGIRWPKNKEETVNAMVSPPTSLSEWHLKNLVWQTVVKHFVFLIDAERGAYSPDLTVQVTAAKVLGNTCIGVMSAESRAAVSSHYSAMADVTVVGGKTGILSLLLGNLGEQ